MRDKEATNIKISQLIAISNN